MDIKKSLGLKIKTLRKKNKYTREQFAELIEIAPRTLYGIESGRNFVTAETLERIISVLNISVEDLFVDVEPLNPENMINFIKTEVDNFKNEPEKLLFLYKITKQISYL